MRLRYIPRLEAKLSPLGFGVFRLPMQGDDFPESVYSMLSSAMDMGINYYDTAWPYLGGKSEYLINRAIVQKYPRDKFYIADKLPIWELRTREDMERVFNSQMERLNVEYIDFYLLHAVRKGYWDNVYHGGLEFLSRKQREGRIHKVGFSFHDTPEFFSEVLKSYDWDFAQLQINYLDWDLHNARLCYDMLATRNIPCIVMEPLRGGTLSKLPTDVEAVFYGVHQDWSMSSWGLRYVATLPNVAVTLSGMNTYEQLEDNIKTFSSLKKLTRIEVAAIREVTEKMLSRIEVPCTECGYCLGECPKKIAIPTVLQGFNESQIYRNILWYFSIYIDSLHQNWSSDLCIGCEKCMKRCPQNIRISSCMKKINNVVSQFIFGVSFNRLLDVTKSVKTLVLFGAGSNGQQGCRFLENLNFQGRIIFCDNSTERWGTKLGEYDIIPPSELRSLVKKNDVAVLISTRYYREDIRKQLLEMGIIEQMA